MRAVINCPFFIHFGDIYVIILLKGERDYARKAS